LTNHPCRYVRRLDVSHSPSRYCVTVCSARRLWCRGRQRRLFASCGLSLRHQADSLRGRPGAASVRHLRADPPRRPTYPFPLDRAIHRDMRDSRPGMLSLGPVKIPFTTESRTGLLKLERPRTALPPDAVLRLEVGGHRRHDDSV
jgi:hypothetical protein